MGPLGAKTPSPERTGNLGPEWTAMTGGGLAIVNQEVTGTNAGGNSGDIRTGEAAGSDQFSRSS